MKYKIPWYTKDRRFTPGTVADVGDIRIRIRKTDRTKNNKWRIYTEWRTRTENGVHENLKREVCVAEYSDKLTLEEIQKKAEEFLCNFVFGILAEMHMEE